MKVFFIDLMKNKKEIEINTIFSVLPFSGSIECFEFNKANFYSNQTVQEEDNRCIIKIGDQPIKVQSGNDYVEVNILYRKSLPKTILTYKSVAASFEKFLIENQLFFEVFETAIDPKCKDPLILCTFSNDSEDMANNQSMNVQKIAALSKVLPTIFNKPKQHLKQICEIRPASVATRIGHESIQYLASHSEHWKGIQVSGLVPDKLMARVLEEDFGIYENIVAKSLINRLNKQITKLRHDTIDCLIQGKVNEATDAYGGDGKNCYIAKKALLRGMKDELLEELQIQLMDQKDNIEEILKITSRCRSSRLYRQLKRKKDITGSLNKTNIFMMDKHYKNVYQIWNLLSQQNTPIKKDVKIASLEEEYNLFTRLLFLFSLKYFDFKLLETSDERAIIANNLFLNNKCFVCNNWKIKVEEKVIDSLGCKAFQVCLFEDQSIEIDIKDLDFPTEFKNNEKYGLSYNNELIVFKQLPTNDEIKALIAHIQKISPKNRAKRNTRLLRQRLDDTLRNFVVKEQTILFIPWKYEMPDDPESLGCALSALLANVKKMDQYDGIYFLTPTRINDFEHVENPRLLKKFTTFNTTYESGTEKITSFVPITLKDINSFRRFQKILLKHIIALNENLPICPICGGSPRPNMNHFLCNECGFEVLQTKCSNCKKSYAFTRYHLPNIDTIEIDSPILGVSYREIEEGFKNITDIEIKNDITTNRKTLNPICPYCGK